MSGPVAFRCGYVSLVQGDAGAWTIYDGQGGGLKLDAESFRWLVQTSGPAALCIPVGEEDAGAGGGPAPAAADGTEAAGSREEAETLAFDVGDQADPHSVACSRCGAQPGSPCMTPDGWTPTKPHVARRRLVGQS